MMYKRIKNLFLVIFVLCLFVLSACDFRVKPENTPTDNPTDNPTEVSKTVTSISLKNSSKTTFFIGDEFTFNGLTITVNYSDDSTIEIPVKAEMLSTVDMSTPGQKTVVITYEGKTTSYVIEVKTAVVEKEDPSITISIENGAEIDLNDMPEIKATTDSDVVLNTYFMQGTTKLGTEVPTTPGTYTFVVESEETETYNAKTIRVIFTIKDTSIPPVEKTNPTVTFSIENGTHYTEGSVPAITIQVPEGVEYEYYYSKDDGETNLGTEVPTTPGIYALNVVTTENDTYKSVTKFVWYVIEAKTELQEPTVTFSIENGTHYTEGSVPAITIQVPEGVEYEYYYSKDDGETNLGTEVPTTPGIYALNVVTTENDTYKSVSKFVWYVIEAKTELQEPTVTFSIENGTHYTEGSVPTITIQVPEGVEYEYYYSKDDGETNLGTEVPTTPGIYALNVVTTENDTYKSVTKFVWYVIEAKTELQEPTVTFSIENGTHYTEGSVPAITIQVPEGVEYTYYYTTNDGETNLGTEVPTTAGTYALNVVTTENDTYKTVSKFVWYVIEAKTELQEPTVTFSIESGTHYTEGSVPAITIQVPEGVEYTYYYTTNDGETNLGTEVPTTAGTYALNVVTTENDTYKSVTKFIWYVIDEKVELQEPTVTFSIESGTHYTEGSVPAITIQVPEGVEYTYYYTTNDGETNLGTEVPTTPGIYALNVVTTENDTYKSVTKFIWYVIDEKVELQEPTVTFSIESGTHYTEGSVPAITIQVPEGVEYTYYYTTNDGETNLGTEVPTTPGIYALNVVTTENDTYKSVTKFIWYVIDEKVELQEPTVTFSIESGTHYTEGSVPAITIQVPEGVEYTYYYTTNDGETNLGTEVPTTAGTYALNVVTTENDTYKSVSKFVWYVIEAKTELQEPTVTFSIESGTHYTEGSVPAITIQVPEGVEYTYYYTTNDGETNLGTEVPTTAGTYALNVVTTENDTYKTVTKFVWYVIDEKVELQEPTVTFSIESGTHYTEGSVPAITIQVPEGVEYTYYYTTNDGETNLGTEVPTTAGTYALNVVTTENDTYKSVTKFVWYVIDEKVELQEPTVTFSIENGTHYTEGSVPAITIQVLEGVEYTYYYTTNDGETNLGTEVPTTAGTYALNVVTTENDTYKSVTKFVWYVIDEKVELQEPTVTFSIESGTHYTEGSVPAITIQVLEGVEYTYYYTTNDGETNLGTEVPTTAGTYALNVVTTENDTYKSVSKFVWYVIDESTPTFIEYSTEVSNPVLVNPTISDAVFQEIPALVDTTNITFTLSDDGTYYIVSDANYTLDSPTLVIPETYNDLPVQEIAAEGFAYKTWLKTVYIPKTITKIGDGAFNGSGIETLYYNAKSVNDFNAKNWAFLPAETLPLLTVYFGKDVERIPNRLFFPLATNPSLIPNITAVYFSKDCNIKEIGDYAFYGAKNLTHIDFPETVITFGAYSFYQNSLDSLCVPTNCITIKEYAFSFNSFTIVKLNAKLEMIGEYAFLNCDKLEEINFAETQLATINRGSFKNCSALARIAFNSSIETIERNAFENAKALQMIKLPEGLKTVEAEAFLNASKVEVLYLNKNLITLGNSAFDGLTSCLRLVVDSSNLVGLASNNKVFSELGKNTTGATVVFTENVKTISERLFFPTSDQTKTPNISNVVLQKGVEKIELNAFTLLSSTSFYFDGTSEDFTLVENYDLLTNTICRDGGM